MSYICNFLHDLFHVSWISRCSFKDIEKPINSSITKTTFLISSNNLIKNSVVNKNKKSIFYMFAIGSINFIIISS